MKKFLSIIIVLGFVLTAISACGSSESESAGYEVVTDASGRVISTGTAHQYTYYATEVDMDIETEHETDDAYDTQADVIDIDKIVWNINDSRDTMALPAEVEELFEEASDDYSAGRLEPFAIIASRIIDKSTGSREYALLCWFTSNTNPPSYGLKVVFLSEKDMSAAELDLEVLLSSDYNSDADDYTWVLWTSYEAYRLDSDMSALFRSGIADTSYKSATPIAYLGKRASESDIRAFLAINGIGAKRHYVVIYIEQSAAEGASLSGAGIINPNRFMK